MKVRRSTQAAQSLKHQWQAAARHGFEATQSVRIGSAQWLGRLPAAVGSAHSRLRSLSCCCSVPLSSVPSPPPRPLGATTTELESLHSQLLALSGTIELLLSAGALERSADVAGDLLVLYGKLKQFQEVTDQATREAVKLGQKQASAADRLTRSVHRGRCA